MKRILKTSTMQLCHFISPIYLLLKIMTCRKSLTRSIAKNCRRKFWNGKKYALNKSPVLIMNKKILFVDDDINVLNGYKRTYRKKYNLTTAISGQEGLRQLKQAKEDFAVI